MIRPKKYVWKLIANGVHEGYSLETLTGYILCSHKYGNWLSGYRDYVQFSNTTGNGTRAVPKFYEELHSLLKEKHMTTPVSVLDTIQSPDAPQCVLRNKAKKGTPRKRKNTEVLNVLNDIREEEEGRQAKEMSSMDHLMTSLDNHNEILKQSNATRVQEDRRQLAAMHQMHREKMQMQQALIDTLKSSK